MAPALVLLLALLLSAGPVTAEDACLAGGSVLEDERALAALRAATEAACPCAAATRRGPYQRCARATLAAALAGGMLRAACERHARTVVKGAICGTRNRIACGRVEERGGGPPTCRPKRAARCTPPRPFTEMACTGETHCADVVEWTAGTCLDPRDLGPWAPGVRIVRLTKPSAVDPTQARVLDTVVWYPAPPGSAPLAPAYRAVVNAPVDRSGGPYPLLLFSHGSCGVPNQSLFLTALLASWGFVVAAPPHPGNTLAEFPACRSSSAVVASAVERPQDVLFALEAMLAADGDPASPFLGAIDETRLGMSGHSFGGFTTYVTVPLEPRFRAAVPMAPAVPGSPVLAIPSLTLIGAIDSVVNNAPTRTAYAAAQSPKYFVEVGDAGHYAFSDLCFPSPDCDPPTTRTQDEAHALVLRFVLPFLQVHLAGDARFAPLLGAPPPAGVAFAAAP
jgi:predicted dienelactone hydrolase